MFQGTHKPQQNVSCSVLELIVWWSRKNICLVYAQYVDRATLKCIIFVAEQEGENVLRKQEGLWAKAINSDCQFFPTCYTSRSGLNLQPKYWTEPGADFSSGTARQSSLASVSSDSNTSGILRAGNSGGNDCHSWKSHNSQVAIRRPGKSWQWYFDWRRQYSSPSCRGCRHGVTCGKCHGNMCMSQGNSCSNMGAGSKAELWQLPRFWHIPCSRNGVLSKKKIQLCFTS